MIMLAHAEDAVKRIHALMLLFCISSSLEEKQ